MHHNHPPDPLLTWDGIVVTPDNVDRKDSRGWTILAFLTACLDVEGMRIVLEMGARVDACADYNTPLNMLLSCPVPVRKATIEHDAVCLLIEYGARTTEESILGLKYSETYAINAMTPYNTLMKARAVCGAAALALASLVVAGCPLGHVRRQDVNVLRLVAKHVWSTRFDEEWE